MAEANRDVGGGPATSIEANDASSGDAPGASLSVVYTELRLLLEDRGWARGGGAHGRLTLDEAVDQLLGTSSGKAAAGPDLARAARVALHLRELSGSSNLAAWNDARERRFDDVRALLDMAAIAFPGD